MPQVENTFLKSKMNKDLDSRILPNGEYRDAQNLQVSRSQGSEVGEFENVLGNQALKTIMIEITEETDGPMVEEIILGNGFKEVRRQQWKNKKMSNVLYVRARSD